MPDDLNTAIRNLDPAAVLTSQDRDTTGDTAQRIRA